MFLAQMTYTAENLETNTVLILYNLKGCFMAFSGNCYSGVKWVEACGLASSFAHESVILIELHVGLLSKFFLIILSGLQKI